jgi:hypothetical protein
MVQVRTVDDIDASSWTLASINSIGWDHIERTFFLETIRTKALIRKGKLIQSDSHRPVTNSLSRLLRIPALAHFNNSFSTWLILTGFPIF